MTWKSKKEAGWKCFIIWPLADGNNCDYMLCGYIVAYHYEFQMGVIRTANLTTRKKLLYLILFVYHSSLF